MEKESIWVFLICGIARIEGYIVFNYLILYSFCLKPYSMFFSLFAQPRELVLAFIFFDIIYIPMEKIELIVLAD